MTCFHAYINKVSSQELGIYSENTDRAN